LQSKILILFILIFFVASVNGQEKIMVYQNKKVQMVPFAKIEPFIDGKLSDEIWNQTPPIVLTHLSGLVGSPYEKTNVRVVTTKTHIFLSYYCEETKPNELIAKAQNADDDMSNDDAISFLISPGLEKDPKVFLLSVNSKGIVSDSLNNDKSWGWDGATIVVTKGETFWVVEMSLPIAVFEKEYKKAKTKGWRANFYRIRPERGWDDRTASSWASINGSSIFDVDQAGYIFLEALNEKTLEGTAVLGATPEWEYLSLPAAQVPVLKKDEILIDGDIREQINGGAIGLLFKQLDNKPNPTTNKIVPLTHKTEAWVCTVKNTLVVSIRCYDSSMDKLLSTEKIRDGGSIWADDSVEIFLKIGPDENGPYYHIAVNAHGSIYDSYDLKPNWNGNNIKAAALRKDNFWDVEVQIPFDDLDKDIIKATISQPWRFNIVRHRASHFAGEGIEEGAWSPTFSNKSHVPAKFGYIFMDEFNARPK